MTQVNGDVERTLVLIKPDGVKRALIGEILGRIEAKGYEISALEMRTADTELLTAHYEEHVGKPLIEPLGEFTSSGPVFSAVVTGQRVIESLRTLAGATDPIVATPGTIRGDLGRDCGLKVVHDLVHGSDAVASAEREIALWFPNLAN